MLLFLLRGMRREVGFCGTELYANQDFREYENMCNISPIPETLAPDNATSAFRSPKPKLAKPIA